MITRNNYPIYEPVFKNWRNIGVESEEQIIARKREAGDAETYIGWRDKKQYLDILCKDYNWMYMEVRLATNTDENRECKWCRQKLAQYEVHTTNDRGYVTTTFNPPEGMEINKFHKGDVVIREQHTMTGFETLHVDCATEKLAAIKENIARGEDRLHNLIIASENIQKPKRRRSNQ